MKFNYYEVKDKLKKCIMLADQNIFRQLLLIEDDVAWHSIDKWFEDYFIRYRAVSCEIILDETHSISNSEFHCFLRTKYRESDDYNADLLVTVKTDTENNEVKIAAIEQYHSTSPENNLSWHAAVQGAVASWSKPLRKVKISENIDWPSSRLARSISRNIRFREAHIQLECASIMAFMMSAVIPHVVQQINLGEKTPEQKLKLIYDTLLDKFRLQITRPDRDNTWASKYLAPWYGLEEVIAGRDGEKDIAVSCNFFMSALYAFLRWSGFTESQLVQFRIINQDYLLVRCGEQKMFFVSHDNLTWCRQKTIYPSGKIDRVFGAEWFIDFKNNRAEISPYMVRKYNEIAKNTFLPEYCLTGREYDMIPLSEELFTKDFRYRVFGLDHNSESTIYPWIKYANQTLYVSKPGTYIYWSIQSNWGNINFNSEEEIYDYLSHLGEQSIFPEADRIMTADQCIRHQTAGTKDRALFLLAALIRFLRGQGCIVFTSKYEYVIYRIHDSDDWVIYNQRLQIKSSRIEGEIVLAFHNTNSYYLLRDNDHAAPVWLREIMGEVEELKIFSIGDS